MAETKESAALTRVQGGEDELQSTFKVFAPHISQSVTVGQAG